ncbi:Retrovirus-related Pol polyprotein from transposon 17.6 [Operophtera brumata]|uniref:Retrovirus-related Pol polyprotein from transposon 17.6 n=1 Tax=Operophtera brumata TaxID=104452 RepID=A0A0L7LAV6_OPEBR|nr:Retrovirus-related Pol polyprotein from transposon 17.6 [Operophtera brumata]
MLPNATESLLGMNFIKDSGMVLDFIKNVWYMSHNKAPQPMLFERKQSEIICSSVGLREDEGAHLNSDERKQQSDLLNFHEDIVTPGGGPTQYAIHHIDTDYIDSRDRPVLSVEINGALGKVLVDTGAKYSVGSVSLRAHLVKSGSDFKNVYAEFKYADGRVCAQYVELAHVKMTVRGLELGVDFVMLPNATESLLGMTFIKDSGMVLDFIKNVWYMSHNKAPQPMLFERKQLEIICSSVGLREDEGAHLNSDEREQLSDLLNFHEDIFTPGGGPTQYAIHHIDTGDALPIACPPYRVTPARKEIIRKEIEKMLEEDIIEEAESEWASPWP